MESWPPAIRAAVALQPDADVLIRSFPRGFPHAGPFVAVAALVRDVRGRILLVRHVPGTPWGDRWATPGGVLRAEEDAATGLRREIVEESGLELEHPHLLRVVVMEDERHTTMRVSFTLIYGAAVSGARPPVSQTGDRVAEARWFEGLPPNMVFREEYEDLL